MHCIALHCIALHYITLHYTTLHYTTLHYTTLHYTTLRCTTLHYTTLHYTTLHYITVQYSTVQYSTVHYITLHYITLHYITYIHTYIHYIHTYFSLAPICIPTTCRFVASSRAQRQSLFQRQAVEASVVGLRSDFSRAVQRSHRMPEFECCRNQRASFGPKLTEPTWKRLKH